jgi:hypothetical protein
LTLFSESLRPPKSVKNQTGGYLGTDPPLVNEVMDCVLTAKFNDKVGSSGIK